MQVIKHVHCLSNIKETKNDGGYFTREILKNISLLASIHMNQQSNLC